MGIIIRIIVLLLTFLFPLAPAAPAAEQAPGQFYHLQFNRTAVTTPTSASQKSSPPAKGLDQLASLLKGRTGLALGDSAAIVLLCSRLSRLNEPGSQKESLVDLGVGLKITF